MLSAPESWVSACIADGWVGVWVKGGGQGTGVRKGVAVAVAGGECGAWCAVR